ncbi:hypothetical protein KJ669_02010 [Patescibacteria group bacterium]|nr:hypothetical protein [Patescibacteria group bacterium]MBU2080917.1 hypothetical protein [Patescibacteria group bacterium]MBU2124022.1 hypothetical protein [Patescibacteria group bacterium]MBU2194687.1 hypothetical protein [Patescibacteria group bacterium]MBU2329947.1 hypothetical protein [Patescibacteria group bacterium]
MERIHTIVLPVRPQPDTLVAIFLLQTFGKQQFPGVETAKVTIDETPPTRSFKELCADGILMIDSGKGPFDHHGTDKCATELVAEYLGLSKDPSVKKLLTYAKRDDAEGKGTLSADPIDRAFGLSGLVSSLKKKYSNDPQKIVDIVLPLLDAHYFAAWEHHVGIPEEIVKKKADGRYSEAKATQENKKLKVVFVVSDKTSMPTYLRSWNGVRADVVVQKNEDRSRTCVITRQEVKVDLTNVAALIRMREAELRGLTLPADEDALFSVGRVEGIASWYLDPATNSLLNVGEKSDDTRIEWEELQQIVLKGLQLQLS